jgi:hypothetical protein
MKHITDHNRAAIDIRLRDLLQLCSFFISIRTIAISAISKISLYIDIGIPAGRTQSFLLRR